MFFNTICGIYAVVIKYKMQFNKKKDIPIDKKMRAIKTCTTNWSDTKTFHTINK